MSEHGGMAPIPPPGKMKMGRVCADRPIRFRRCGGCQGQGLLLNMGQAPYPITRKMAVYAPMVRLLLIARGGTGEHLLSDKSTNSAAYRADRLHIPSIRVSPSAGARAGLADCTAPVVRVWHNLCKHALPSKTADSAACRADRLRRTVVRVWHNLCEHALPGKIIGSAACRDNRFHIPIIRV